MPASIETNTTDLPEPTPSEMEAMWLAARAEDAEEVRAFERRRAGLNAWLYEEVA